MEVDVARAAEQLGVSPRRVQVLLSSGRLPGRRVGRSWLLDEEHLVRVARRSRPLAPAMARALIAVLSGERHDLDTPATTRLRALVSRLAHDADPAAQLAAWVPVRPEQVQRLAVAEQDLHDLRADARVVPTGVSDLRSGIVDTAELDARIWSGDVDGLSRDFLLSTVGRPNVCLYLDAHPLVPGRQLPFGRFLVDLSARPGPRESAAVRRLLRSAELVV